MAARGAPLRQLTTGLADLSSWPQISQLLPVSHLFTLANEVKHCCPVPIQHVENQYIFSQVSHFFKPLLGFIDQSGWF